MAWGYGTHYGLQMKNILTLCKVYNGRFRGLTKGREREGSRQLVEEEMWENSQGWSYVNRLLVSRHVNRLLVTTFIWLCMLVCNRR